MRSLSSCTRKLQATEDASRRDWSVGHLGIKNINEGCTHNYEHHLTILLDIVVLPIGHQSKQLLERVEAHPFHLVLPQVDR